MMMIIRIGDAGLVAGKPGNYSEIADITASEPSIAAALSIDLELHGVATATW
jgi:hypothetical protein